MPIRTYENVDFINYVAGFTANNGLTNTALASPTSNFNFVISSSGTNTPYLGNLVDDVAFIYDASGDIDFSAFPAIPDNALISEVEVKIDVSLTATASSDSTNNTFGTPCSAGGTILGKVLIPDLDNPGSYIELTNLSVNEIDFNFGTSPQSASASHIDHYTNVQTFDYSGSPITKAALEAQFTSWLVRLSTASWTARSNISLGGSFTGNTSEVLGFSFDGIRITVTYELGPEVSFTMDPSSGPVEIGQTVTVTGPNAADLPYAAIIGDKVIPIIPKVISRDPDEVLLEIPYPPTDACFDCFGDCPDCDICFTVCDNDLIGEDCQTCIADCLQCLYDCLEDLALAEECQESTGTTIDEGTGVTIIIGTQFRGSVTLGSFTILVANGSGIYRFVANKSSDTLYTAARDGTTYDVKIPNPGGKTGFFRS